MGRCFTNHTQHRHQTLNELIDLYDTAIKAMKASPETKSDVEKTQKFKEMLGPYLKLLKNWSTMTVESNKGYDAHRYKDYLQKLESIFQKLSDSDPNQQWPSSHFSVNAAVLSAKTNFAHHYPKTLEDVFTLIHQNLLDSIAIMSNKLLSTNQIQTILLPSNLKKALNYSENIETNSYVGYPKRIGVNVCKTSIAFSYNIPLREHSAKFNLQFDRQTGKLKMEVKFLGGNENNRWTNAAERVSILHAAGIISLLSKPKDLQQELTFSWDISNPEKIKFAFDEFHEIAVHSFNVAFGSITSKESLQEDFTLFFQNVEKHGNLPDVILMLLKENTRSDFGREIMTSFIIKMGQIPKDSASFFHMIMQSSLAQQLISPLIYQVNGEEFKKTFYLETVLANYPEEKKACIKRLLEHCKNDSSLTQLLTNASGYGSYFEEYKKLWAGRALLVSVIAAFIAISISYAFKTTKQIEQLKLLVNFPQDALALKKFIELDLKDWLLIHPECKKFVPELLELKALYREQKKPSRFRL